jgi:hypothetical protein
VQDGGTEATYRSTSLGIALTGPGAGDGAEGARKGEPGVGALTILTAFFLNLNVPAFAAGWTAKLPRAS